MGAPGYHHIRLLRDLAGVDVGLGRRAPPRGALKVAGELWVRPLASLDELMGAVDALTTVVLMPGALRSRAGRPGARSASPDREAPGRERRRGGRTAGCSAAERRAAADRPRRCFNRAVRGALPLVQGPRFIESDRLAPFTPRGADVAVVLDLMIHDIDPARMLMPDRVADVAAVGVPLLTYSSTLRTPG